MPKFQQKDGQGSLFKNERKEKDTHPDYRGDCLINGQAMWISAWIKKGKNGSFMSLAFKPKEDNQGRRQAGVQESRGGGVDEDIPFSQLRKVESSLL